MPLPLYIVLEVLATATSKKRKVIQIGKEEVKLTLCISNKIFYIENPKDLTPKMWKLINEFNKVAGYKYTEINYISMNNNKISAKD